MSVYQGMKRWGSKHMDHARQRCIELVQELWSAAGKTDPQDLLLFAGRRFTITEAHMYYQMLRDAGFSKARSEQEVQLVRDLAEGRVIRQMLYVAISDAGHACGPTRESVAGDGDVEQVIRYRRVDERKAA